jgi:hypothetical protein
MTNEKFEKNASRCHCYLNFFVAHKELHAKVFFVLGNPF